MTTFTHPGEPRDYEFGDQMKNGNYPVWIIDRETEEVLDTKSFSEKEKVQTIIGLLLRNYSFT